MRLTANAIVLILLSMIVFALMNFKSPADIARSVLGREVATEQIDEFIANHGLDKGIALRYVAWVSNAVRADLGRSVITDREVAPDVIPRFLRSLSLAAVGGGCGAIFGILTGVFLARRFGSRSDFHIVTGLLMLASMPEFLIGIALYLTFVVWLGWFPTQSEFAFAFGTSWARAQTFVLPALTIAILIVPHVARVARISTAEALAAPYVVAARLRGLSEFSVKWDHAFRNAAVSLVSVVGLNLVYAMAGVVVVEYLFGFPGMGSLLVQSIASGDLFVTQAIIMLFACVVIAINMIVDVGILWLNPRLRFLS